MEDKECNQECHKCNLMDNDGYCMIYGDEIMKIEYIFDGEKLIVKSTEIK